MLACIHISVRKVSFDDTTFWMTLSQQNQAAQRRAVVRRSTRKAIAFYACHILVRSKLRAMASQIAVPGDGPAMRGGLTPLTPRSVVSAIARKRARHPTLGVYAPE